MTQTHKLSFRLLAVLIFLLPIFFVPGGSIFLDNGKSALMAIGVIGAVIAFIWESSRSGSATVPWHYFLGATIILPVVYLLSALLSTPSSLSLFGYGLEAGTFGFMVLASSLLVLIAVIFSTQARIVWGIIAFIASGTLLALFLLAKLIFGGDFLELGMFPGNMSSPAGGWTDLAVLFGLIAVLSIPAIHMTPAPKRIKIALLAVFALSTALLAIINFSLALVITLLSSVVLFVYFSTVEGRYSINEKKEQKRSSLLPIILGVVSLVFLMNPVISSSGNTIGDSLSNIFNVQNTDIRPSFATTLSISRAVLKKDALLGSGPNTFGSDWLAYKPADINATPFWNVSFPFGIGFIPTQVASTGIIGSLFWIAFFAFFLILGKKALDSIPESRADRFVLLSSFIASFFLWIAAIFYAPSMSVLGLTFIFSGLFAASSRIADTIPSYKINFKDNVTASFVSTLLAVAIVFGSLALGLGVFQKTVSAYYFKKALKLSATPDTSVEVVDANLVKALRFAPADAHYIALAQLNFSKAQAIATRTEGEPEENRKQFEDALARSITAARSAVDINPKSFQGWIALGSIYGALVAEPLKVDGAYESAKAAYAQAALLSPSNPEIPLLLANLELAHDNIEGARVHIAESLALKQDYADAYFTLAQLEVREKNIPEAIRSAETGALLSPENAGLYFEIGLLKYSNGSFDGAVKSFGEALRLAPEYANAKYYLGLSLARLGKNSEALVHFEELAETNPENEEVAIILGNLRAGKDPLQGLPDSANNLEERDSPPISNIEQ